SAVFDVDAGAPPFAPRAEALVVRSSFEDADGEDAEEVEEVLEVAVAVVDDALLCGASTVLGFSTASMRTVVENFAAPSPSTVVSVASAQAVPADGGAACAGAASAMESAGADAGSEPAGASIRATSGGACDTGGR